MRKADSSSIDSITLLSAPPEPLRTSRFFDENHKEPPHSPIDLFIINSNRINLLFVTADTINPELANVVLLGFMSATESYFRAVIRGLILIDEVCKEIANSKPVSYGAATHHSKELLPEALIEGVSFSNSSQVKDGLRDFLGIKGHIDADLSKMLSEYQKICEIRHCCVHRFGRLGSQNAIKLGLKDHQALLEKPLTIDREDIESIALTLRVFIKSYNNFVFRKILERSAKNKSDTGSLLYSENWTWNLSKDKKRFKSYYDLFSSKEDATPSPSLKDLYEDFRERYRKTAGKT